MKITDEAKKFLEEVLKENQADGIRLHEVPGCCGPQYAISLDAAQETDKVDIVNGIRIAVDSQIDSTDELTLDFEESQGNAGLVLIGANNCC